LAAALASLVGPPLYAVFLLFTDQWFLAPLVFVAWLVWLPHGRKLVRWLLQGHEYSSL
jgi:hypothetical protein